jgi:hypothetical protein
MENPAAANQQLDRSVFYLAAAYRSAGGRLPAWLSRPMQPDVFPQIAPLKQQFVASIQDSRSKETP